MSKGIKLIKLSSAQRKEILHLFSQYSSFPIDLIWHQFYSSINGYDKRYIPIDFLFSIVIPTLNNHQFTNSYTDKNRYEDLFKGVIQPTTLFKRMNGDYYLDNKIVCTDAIIERITTIPKGIVKPSIESGQGKGVSCFYGEKMTKSDITKFLSELGPNYIAQECLESHPILKNLNPTSFNTIRIITYRRGSEVFVLSSTLKIGKFGEIVDNGHNGGTFCGINNGYLRKYNYSLNPFTKSEKTPNGTIINNISIPNYSKLISTVKDLALSLPYSRYAGWDMGLNNAGEPVLIEVNLSCPGGNIMQIPNGPLFGDYTDLILKDISTCYNK